MRKLVFFAHTTVDGFIAKADDELWERFPWGAEGMVFSNDLLRAADTWVFGRRMYEAIVPWWDTVADGLVPDDVGTVTALDKEFAALQRGLTKVVVSQTLADQPGARTVIDGDVAEQIAALKQQPGKDILLSCGPGLLAPLADRPGLIDRYLVIVHPAAIGSGKPLFGGLTRELSLDLVDTEVFPGGCIALRYQPT